MPEWFQTLLDLLAQFTGGRTASGPPIVSFGIAAVGWGILAYGAAVKRRREPKSREQLLLVGFLFGFGREVGMLLVSVLTALGLIDPSMSPTNHSAVEPFFLNVAMVLIAAAFMRFVTDLSVPVMPYLKVAIPTITLCSLAIVSSWWIGHSRASVVPPSVTWGEWSNSTAMLLLLAYPLVTSWRHSTGWTRAAVCGALLCFWLFQLLKLSDIATNGLYTSVIVPFDNALYLSAIPLFAYVFFRELVDEVGKRGEALHFEERRMRGLLDNLDVVVGEWGLPDLKLRFMSQQAEKLFDYPLEKWKSLSFWSNELVHPEDRHWVLSFCQGETEACRDHDFEYRVVTGSGCTRWIHEYVQLVNDHNGRPERLVCVMVDVTKQKEVEATLREERDFAKSLIDTAQAIVVVLDIDGRVSMCNPYLEQLSGLTLDEVRGKDWFDTFLPGRDHRRIRKRFQQALSVKPTHGETNPIITKDGSEREISWWDKGLQNADGEFIGLLCIGYDVTERLRMEDDLKQANEELDARVRERTRELELAQEELVRQDRLATLGQLAGSVAHEIRNPLAVIRNNIYYFEATLKNAEDDTKEAFKEMYRAMDDSEHIIQELLDFARDPKPNESDFVLQEALKLAIKGINRPANVELIERHEDSAVQCHGDLNQIARILGNLIRNGMEEMGKGGTMTIESQVRGDDVAVSVTDTGGGIPPENQERIFEPLHTGKTKGIGLGLAISKRYAELNHASLSVSSHVRQGTKFLLILKRRLDA